MSINSAMGVLERKILPTPQLATRELSRILNAQPGDREAVLGDLGEDTRFRVGALLEGVGENHENAELLRRLEEHYRESLTTLTYFNLIGPHQPGIQGVDGVNRTIPTWDSIQVALTPEHLDKIKELEEPRLLVVPWSMDLLTQLNTAERSSEFDYLNYIGAFGTSETDSNLNALADRKTGKGKADCLKKNLHFNGWRVVIVDGAQTTPKHTFNKNPDELAQEFESQGFSFMEPEDSLMLHLLGFKQKRPYDKDRGTWLNARPNNSDKVMGAGNNKDGSCMQFFSSKTARPLIGGRRAFEILPSGTPVIVEHDAIRAIEAAQALEEIAPRNPAEEFILEQGVADKNDFQALLEKLRRARQPSAFDLAVTPVAEAAALSSPPPAQVPPQAAPPPESGRPRRLASPVGIPAIPPPVAAAPVRPEPTPVASRPASAPATAPERRRTPQTLPNLIDALFFLSKKNELTPEQWQSTANQVIRSFFAGPGKDLDEQSVEAILASGENPRKIELLASHLGFTADQIRQKIMDGLSARPVRRNWWDRLRGR